MTHTLQSSLPLLVLAVIVIFGYPRWDHLRLRRLIGNLERRINSVAPELSYLLGHAEYQLKEAKRKLSAESRWCPTGYGPWISVGLGMAAMNEFDRWLKETGGKEPASYA